MKKEFEIDESMKSLIRFNGPLTVKKAIHELQGAAAAIIYDGTVDNKEIEFLTRWLSDHKEEMGVWPISEVSEVLYEILEDNMVTPEERVLLFDTLSKFATGTTSNKVVDDIYDINPKLEFLDREFLFTGILRFGRRKKAENAVLDRGGIIAKSSAIPRTLHYLIVGDLGNLTWKHSRFGNKLEKAIERRRNGDNYPLLVNERDFVRAIA